MCASTLHAATGAIEKTMQLITKLAPTATAKKQATEKKVDDVDGKSKNLVEEDINELPKGAAKVDIDSTAPKTTSKSEAVAKGTPKKNQPSPNKSAKQNESHIVNLDDSLNGVVKLTPSKNAPKKNKEATTLFGTSIISDSEDEVEEEADNADDVADNAEISLELPEIFACKLCDFETNRPLQLKTHLIDAHDKKRPRFVDCPQCPKTFSGLGGLKKHFRSHGTAKDKLKNKEVPNGNANNVVKGDTEAQSPVKKKPKAKAKASGKEAKESKANGTENQNAKENGEAKKNDEAKENLEAKSNAKESNKTIVPQLATFEGLQGKRNQKVLANVSNSELTFAVGDSNSSTPAKTLEEKNLKWLRLTKFVCEICQIELKTAKAMQEHSVSAHKIDKPKVFKCDACEDRFTHRGYLLRHLKAKHSMEDGKPKVSIKLPIRRKTIDVRPDAINKEPETNVAKIPKRRKTVDVRPKGLGGSPINQKMQSLIKEELITPYKSISKNKSLFIKEEETSVDPLDFPGDIQSDEVQQSIELDSDDEGEVTVISSPSKQKSKRDSKTIGTPKQKDAADIVQDVFTLPVTPKNKSKADNNSVTPSTSSPAKAINNTKSPSLSPRKKSKTAKELDKELETSQSTDKGSPTKARKRKSVPDDDALDTQEAREVQAKVQPAIDLLDEVNLNVKPHKRTRLDTVETLDSQLSCSECNKVTTSRKRLDSHIRKKHSKSFCCPDCNRKYPGSLEYISHFATCNTGQGLPCGIQNCDKRFEAANYMSSHLKKKHKLI